MIKLTKSLFNKLKISPQMAIFGVVVLAVIVRLYYFFLTDDQTLWWDEAEYMATAKHWAFGVPYDLNPQRPPLFQLLAALLLKIGFEEFALKFLLVLVPSVALIIATYYLGKELYNHKIALASAIGVSFVWSLLFWSARFQPCLLYTSPSPRD